MFVLQAPIASSSGGSGLSSPLPMPTMSTPPNDPLRRCVKCSDRCPGYAPHFWR